MTPTSFGIFTGHSFNNVWAVNGLIAHPFDTARLRDTDPTLSAGGVVFHIEEEHIFKVAIVRDSPPDTNTWKGEITVFTDFLELGRPVPVPKELLDAIQATLQTRNPNHSSNRSHSLDLHPVTPLLGKMCWNLVNQEVAPIFSAISDNQTVLEFLDQQAFFTALSRPDLSAEMKVAMADAYHKRGSFRAAVIARNQPCPFSTIKEEGFDDADNDIGRTMVFIKPWHLCSDLEKIDPENAFLIVSELVSPYSAGAFTLTPEGDLNFSSFVDRYRPYCGSRLQAHDCFPVFEPSSAQAAYWKFRESNGFLGHLPK